MRPTSRWSTLLSLLRFVRRNPGFALRGATPHRLRKLKAALVQGNTSAVESWLQERLSTVSGQPTAQQLMVPTVGRDERLEFPVTSRPNVSIVVPVHDGYETTLACLKSILTHTEAGYELIVADDCSGDETATITQRISGIVHVRTPRRIGLLASCNHAAPRARGDYLVLLMNCSHVRHGWLTAVLRVFEQHADVGVVGPKRVREDGSLQDTGGIVWKDGLTRPFGCNENVEAPEYNYVRDVDFASLACLATRVGLWRQIGGFDLSFSPAPYGDVDYCFSVREAGYRVVYQPLALVVDKDGISNRRDEDRDIQERRPKHQRVFCEKWLKTLAASHFDSEQHTFLARDRSGSRTRVLVIDHYVPHHDQDAGSRSTYLHLRYMVRLGLNVKFVGANFFPHQPYTRALQALGIEVLVGQELAASWRDWLRDYARYIDVVCLHRPHIAEQFLTALKQFAPQARLVYFGVDLHYLRVSREASLKNSQSLARQADDWKRRELEIFRQVDTVCFPSQVEIDEIRRELPHADLRTMPLYVLDAPTPSSDYRHAERKDILFVGGFNHPPNEDAVLWFCRDVMPQLLTDLPDLRLHIVGAHPTTRVHQLRSCSIIVHGFLSDAALKDLYGQVRVAVVPVRFGAGVKGKIVEALNYAVPIVTTPIGAEGLPEATSVMRVAETAQDFCASIRDLYVDPSHAGRYLSRYREYIDRWFGEEAITSFLQNDVVTRARLRAESLAGSEQLSKQPSR